ncbi:MAG: RNA polymerase sigma factor [Cellulosimicrobium cellulans]|uniref:RNA polymerase sigma factor n=1 Tax=Cellulosimicrobium cellulans TaxID=1710 RepID=UPI001ED9FF01|nr:sigma-70 family RNA polymerase sigma factor [Cellulosimicrobium cellulans]UKJ62271.1 sigma-70 family RNA polymerase sigma factor [Cellulosimicrobium cellulans]
MTLTTNDVGTTEVRPRGTTTAVAPVEGAPRPSSVPEGEPTDVELFDRARAGDTGAMDLVWRRYYPYALAAARRFTRSASDADDLAAEAFTRILTLLRRGQGPREHARTYIARTVRNVATDRSRRREPITVVIDEARDVASAHDPASEAAMLVELFETLDCLGECSPRQRYALYMTACEGRSIAEVAAELGISANAVAALLVRGREAIRRALARRTMERVATNRRLARRQG